MQRHEDIVRTYAPLDCRLIVFPELSLTNYEPTLAATLATVQSDSLFDPPEQAAIDTHTTIIAGMPSQAESGICISAFIFHSDVIPF